MNNNETNKFAKSAGKKAGIDIEQMKRAAQNGTLDDFINSNLSPDVKKQLESILSDKSKTEKLLSTPQAKEIMKKLGSN